MFFRKPVFLLSGRENIGGFFCPGMWTSKFASIKGHGVYKTTERSYILDGKSGKPIFLANKEIGATIPKEWPEIIKELEKITGKEIKDSKDYKLVIADAIQREGKEAKFTLKSGETIKISDLQQFFPLNIQPTFLEEYGQLRAQQERRKQKNTMNMLSFAVLILIIGIAGYLLIGKANENKTVCSVDLKGLEGFTPSNPPSTSLTGEKTVIPEIKEESQPGGRLT